MGAKTTLRRRLVLAFVLFAVVIGAGFAGLVYVIVEAMESELIDMHLARIAAGHIAGASVGSESFTGVIVAVGSQIPKELDKLAAGHHEIELGGREVHVLMGTQDGERYAIIDDTTEFESIEHLAFISLCIAFVAGVLLAFAIARAVASRIIAPLTALAESVQRDDLKGQPQLLSAADEIGVLARSFDERATLLSDVLRRERFFTADVSHELRTPLTVMLGAAELLSRRLSSQADLHAAAERIRRTANTTSVRVSALLQLARSPETMERTNFSLKNLVDQEIERCRPLLDGKPVALTLESPDDVWVCAARDLAAIAVGNLLRNACYFTERGAVHIVLGSDGMSIEDSGPGVPPDVRDRLFEPFVRTQAAPAAGSGLGLSIVKRVAEHLGWTIGFEDAPRGGSRFTLTFGPQ
jgi:signal transduction histidine kinase